MSGPQRTGCLPSSLAERERGSKNIEVRKKNKYFCKYIANKIYRRNKSSMENSHSTTSANNSTKKPSTKRIATIKTPNTPYYVEEQLLDQNSFLFSTSIELSVNKIKPEKNYKTRYKSSFQSDRKGILYINLPPEEESNKKVRFSRIEIKFY